MPTPIPAMKRMKLATAGLLAASTLVASEGRPSVPLVWHVENDRGEAVDSRGPDTEINPASLVKVATTLWALERLGPGHRFRTRFATRGAHDTVARTLEGDLIVEGGADPDFHVENAYRVAEALNASGLEVVRGKLLVDERFWMGWEGGSARARRDARKRAEAMASRLRDGLDPERWSRRTRELVDAFRKRTGTGGPLPRVVVAGGVGLRDGPDVGVPLVVHESNPLRTLLKRFNAFSNNDIERLGQSLGEPVDLSGALGELRPEAFAGVSFETLSGLGVNRMSPRSVVRLLRELDHACHRLGLQLADVLPSNGCDPGTLKHFPRLNDGPVGALVAKTGTLVHTDEGVAVLAGRVRTPSGDRYFCVAAPRAGSRLTRSRAAQERWLLTLIERHGGAVPAQCGAAVSHSDHDATVRPAGPDG